MACRGHNSAPFEEHLTVNFAVIACLSLSRRNFQALIEACPIVSAVLGARM
jgi:hypothetical protein